MLSDTDRGWLKYEAKLRDGRGTLARHGSVERQVANYRVAFEHARALEARVRALLVEADVSPLHFPFYYAFARRLDRLSRICSGETLRLEAQAYAHYWAARGLNLVVLVTICVQVFDLAI
jgi:hypothetical protein